MGTITIDKNELKELIVETLEEILDNRKDLIEDLIFGKMIEKGLKTKSVNKEDVFKILDN
ncbi:MAG TPA: hypothetical protein PK385_09435 [Spirochaetota bacterium]|nr:hypothetical protein [Spirochaetota bacterium]HOS33772.1 hypothetical protein [Spirochaetota bacterium]HOS56267.1 hypothetical protein [Spirochaetota bacterium]HPK63028.1 hypothetical protein [Spirochaetota bacterium]HQF78674.1 hypothetical protein [Spirochaetota bacterium]